MSRRLLTVLVALVLVSGGCNRQLGQQPPWCDTDVISSGVLISAQTVRGASHVPCINELRPGWDYVQLVPQSGQTRFWIDSDRVGPRFLEVTFEASCDASGAEEAVSDEPGFPLYVEEIEADFFISVAVIPEGDDPALADYAESVAQEIGSDRVGTRLVRATVDATDDPTSVRIDRALAAGRAAFVVGTLEMEDGTVEVHRRQRGAAGVVVDRSMEPDDAVEEVAAPLGDPVYRARWYYTFENACVTLEFDAAGIGAEKIGYEVMDALGFLDLGPIRDFGEPFGYVIP